jgi:SPP1 family predicted phage head-tail adaptor
MQLGDLKRPITIESFTVSTDDNGQEIKTWADLDTVWGKLAYESGGESFEADQRVAKRVVKWTIRYRDDVDETCRIHYDSKYFNIIAIERVHRKRFLILKCRYADRES